MVNTLKTELKNTVVAMLAEGNSIRSIERMTAFTATRSCGSASAWAKAASASGWAAA